MGAAVLPGGVSLLHSRPGSRHYASELRRTQRGNNNAYCQDNEISWLDWSLLDRRRDLHRFAFAHRARLHGSAAPPRHRRTTQLPIEQVFAKLNALRRKTDPRTVEASWRGIGALLDQFTPRECANHLANTGYAST